VIRFYRWMMHFTDSIRQWAHGNFIQSAQTRSTRRRFYFRCGLQHSGLTYGHLVISWKRSSESKGGPAQEVPTKSMDSQATARFIFWLSPRRRIPCQGMSEESAEKLNPATSAGFKWWRRRESNPRPRIARAKRLRVCLRL
jgi:hypothetical protein